MNQPDLRALPSDVQALFDREKLLVPLSEEARARLASRLLGATRSPRWGERALRLLRRGVSAGVFFLAGALVGARVEDHRNPIENRLVVSPTRAPGAGTPAPVEPWEEVRQPKPTATLASEAVARPQDPPPNAAAAAGAPRVAVVRRHDGTESNPRTLQNPPSQLADERALLETARAAMTRGRWDEAASAIERHAADFPNGQLAEERDSLRVVVLAARGRVAQARTAETRFERAYPTSFFLDVTRAAVDSVTDGVDGGQVLGEPKDGER